MSVQRPEKDPNAQHAIADVWRASLRDVINAFVDGDYRLDRGIRDVAPVSSATAEQIQSYVAAYGETLTELPVDTWQTSVSQWMSGHWEIFVDLWTVESGASDLILNARVFEVGDGFRIEIHAVYVP